MSLQSPISSVLQNVNAATMQINNLSKAVKSGIASRPAVGNTPAVEAITADEFLAAAPEPNKTVFKIIAAAVDQSDAVKLAAALAALQ